MSDPRDTESMGNADGQLRHGKVPAHLKCARTFTGREFRRGCNRIVRTDEQSLQGVWTGAAQQYYSNGEVNEFNDSNDNGKVAPNNSFIYDTTAEWGSDYHANINVQMNYWPAEPTGLGALMPTLWDLMQKTWMPRGEETASYLYNSTGWVTHDEMNPFGYTGMKLGGTTVKDQVNGQQWSDYQTGGAWLVQQVWDHYLFGGADEAFLKDHAWPIIKVLTQDLIKKLLKGLTSRAPPNSGCKTCLRTSTSTTGRWLPHRATARSSRPTSTRLSAAPSTSRTSSNYSRPSYRDTDPPARRT